jgi:hypothetical protein
MDTRSSVIHLSEKGSVLLTMAVSLVFALVIVWARECP